MRSNRSAHVGSLSFFPKALVLVLFLTLFVIGLGLAFGVGCDVTKQRLSHHVQLAESAVNTSKSLLTLCLKGNAALHKSLVTSAQAIGVLARRQEQLLSMNFMNRERVVSGRRLLKVCEDVLAEGRRLLLGAASLNTTMYTRWLQKRRRNLEDEHANLTRGSLRVVLEQRQKYMRALQTAFIEEMCDLTDASNEAVSYGNVCATSKVRYSVVFDIGSTGNRVHVYKYTVSPPPATDAVVRDVLSRSHLVEELFELDHRALGKLDNPAKEAPGVLWDLFLKAKNFVPAELHICTPIEFKATAGLRMLGAGEAAKILAEIREHYRNEVFWMRGEAPVRILDGREEGPLAWLAVNFLLGAFNTSASAKVSTVAIIDIGGGSTQIVFEPEEDVFNTIEPDLRYSTIFANRRVRAYQHSYEGYGLHAATKGLLHNIQRQGQERSGGESTLGNTATPTAGGAVGETAEMGRPHSVSPGNTAAAGDKVNDLTKTMSTPPTLPQHTDAVVAFPCFAVGYEDPLGVKNVKYDDSGKPLTKPSFRDCAALFRDRLLKTSRQVCQAANCGIAGVPQPPLTHFTGDIYAFSFLFDLLKLADSSLLPPGAAVSKDKFEVKLADIAQVAEGHCATLSLARIAEMTATGGLGGLRPEYECMYYSYVYALLRDGYQVPEDRLLHVTKKIRGYETTWSLGASLIAFAELASPGSGARGAQNSDGRSGSLAGGFP